jgi:mannose-6-phosphate isomerase-like protein (cupin superfamily)
MARLFSFEQLPHLHSTRDTRHRLDFVTVNVPVETQFIRADRISYHPGDTAAKHYHMDCHHLFYVLSGNGTLHVDDGSYRLSTGMVTVVAPSEMHWFENDTDENFSFFEFWGSPPKDTIWVTDDV